MSLGVSAFNTASDQNAIVLGLEPMQVSSGLKKWHHQPAVEGYTDDDQIREHLKDHAKRAAIGLYAVGKSLASIFEGCTYEQRLKDNERIGQKSEDRYKGQSQCIMDYLAGRLRIHTMDQAMAIMDIFSKTGPVRLPNKLTVNVRDIKDKLTKASQSGLPVLAMKLDIPFWTEDGEKQIHISELQIAPEDAFPLWDTSYAVYRKMRNLAAYRTKLENHFGGVDLASLTTEWQKVNEDVEFLAATRTQINLEARSRVTWLPALAEARQALVIPQRVASAPELQVA